VSAALSIVVDPGKAFSRRLSDLEAKQLPFATMQAINATAFDTRQGWARAMPEVFDRPTALTLGAVLYTKANRQTMRAQVYIRDEAFKGNAPAKYLLAQVDGGQRRRKAFENRLAAAGILPAGMYAVPGKGAKLDAHGNLPGGQIQAILSQLRAQFDTANNQTEASAGRRRRRAIKLGQRAGDYFVPRRTSRLTRGVYQRITTGFGSAVRTVLYFTPKATYRKRYRIVNLAQEIFDQRFPLNFEIHLERAVASSWKKAFGP
jgi:hypothetical protein